MMDSVPSVVALPVAASDDRAERLASLFDAHYERLYRLARRLSPSAEDALDLVQDALLRAATAIDSVPAGNAAEEAWLVRVLLNLQRDRWRKDNVRKRHRRSMAPRAGGPDPEPALVARHTVWTALDALGPRRRAIVILHELEELPVRAIASLLGIAAVTVRWHLFRGRRELADLVNPTGRGR